MQKVKLPWQGFIICAVWACGLSLLQGAVTSQASQPTQDETAAKPKRHSKKSADATSPQTTLPGETGEKTSRAKRAKAPASDVTSSNSANRAMTSEGKTATPAKNASSAEIQAAKASGQVWVNTNSGVYHKGGRWYGATKEGKFMSEQDAIKAGYKEAKNEK